MDTSFTRAADVSLQFKKLLSLNLIVLEVDKTQWYKVVVLVAFTLTLVLLSVKVTVVLSLLQSLCNDTDF